MPHRVIPQERMCTVCKKAFKGPKYGPCLAVGDGGPHTVEAKQYYSASGGLQLQWKTEQSYPDPEGKGSIVRIPGKSAQFIEGKFVSYDAEEQDFMDGYPGLITAQQHYELFVPEKLRVAKALLDDKQKGTIIDAQNQELRKLREQLGLDPETGQPKAKAS